MEIRNTLKEKLQRGEKTAGAWLQMASPMAAEILGLAGFDWLLIDMEHGPSDMTSLVGQLQAMASSPAVPLVRAPWNDAAVIKRILDAGAMGVIVPAVNTVQEAMAAVSACKYPPQGIRGIATGTRAAGFGQFSQSYFAAANAVVLVIVQIETQQGLSNLDDILTVEGIDAIFIGPMDMATSLGHLGNPGHPEARQAIAEIERKTREAGMVLGTVAGDWLTAKALYDRGYQLVSMMSDGVTLVRTGQVLVAQFRSEVHMP